MFDERLMERLRSMEDNPESRMGRDLPRMINSVISHLQRLLNTHQGSVPIAPDYGVPDITNAPGEGFLEATQRIERTLQEVITKYEPRLSSVRLSLVSEREDVLSLRFKMAGLLVQDRNTRVVFETVVSSDGKINVKE